MPPDIHAAQLRDDSIGVRPVQSIGIADCEDTITNAHGMAVFPRCRLNRVTFNLDPKQSEVDAVGRYPDNARRRWLMAKQPYPQTRRAQLLEVRGLFAPRKVAVDHMTIRDE